MRYTIIICTSEDTTVKVFSISYVLLVRFTRGASQLALFFVLVINKKKIIIKAKRSNYVQDCVPFQYEANL